MFPLAVRCSMNNFLFIPSSQWIKPKSEILVEKQCMECCQLVRDQHTLLSRAHKYQQITVNIDSFIVLFSMSFTDLDMQMIVYQDVGQLEVKMEEWGLHAVEEIHTHGCLINHLELLWPHQSVTGQEIVQRSITHVLHHHGSRVTAQSIDGHYVLEFHSSYVGHLVNNSPVTEKCFLMLWILLTGILNFDH